MAFTNYSSEDLIQKNQLSLTLISEKNFNLAESLLKSILENFQENEVPCILELTTINNLSYLYEKLGNSYKSIPLLSRASQFIPKSNFETVCLASTFINLSSVHSCLGFHQAALQNAFKALDLSEKAKILEIKALANYNIGGQLVFMGKPVKAESFFQESFVLAKSHMGSAHKLTILSAKACAAFINPIKTHFRINSTYNSKNSSFSSNSSKINKYSMVDVDKIEPKVKITFSAKIASIPDTGRGSMNKYLIGLPYIKEFRTSKRMHATFYYTPHVDKKTSENSGKNTALSTEYPNTGINRKIGKKLKIIKEYIKSLEDKLQEFIFESRTIFKNASLNDCENLPNQTKAVIVIQKWYKKLLKKTNQIE